MNKDTVAQAEYSSRRKCVCIYNWDLLFNDLITVAAFGFAAFGAYLIHAARTADYTECENTVYLRNSAFGIGVFAIIMGILLGLSTLCCARINIIHFAKFPEDSDWHENKAVGVYVGNVALWILAGSSVFGGIISATDNLFKTYDSTGCDSALYGMTFAGLYVGLLLMWIILGLILVFAVVYWILYAIVCILYSLLIGITNISWREMCGCYVEYVTEQPVQLPITVDTGSLAQCRGAAFHANLRASEYPADAHKGLQFSENGTHKADDLVVENITSPYNTECPVCLTQRTGDNSGIFNTLSCNHAICKDCFDKMAALTAVVACPLCRASSTDV